MTANLEIRDGTPHWWLSPDIWVVPGGDPNGAPGTPVVGQPAFVWARVRNVGNSPASGARVDFWWADPSGQILRSTAHPIGSAFVDLAPGASEEVLCLTPWNVELVNGGHECLIAAASLAGAPPVPDAFDPPGRPAEAQRNLTVAVPAMAAPMMIITAGNRQDKRVRIAASIGEELDRVLLGQLGLDGFRRAKRHSGKIGLATEPIPCHGGERPRTKPEIELHVPRGTRRAVYLDIGAVKLPPREYLPVHVIEIEGERTLGGCTFAIISGEKEAAK